MQIIGHLETNVSTINGHPSLSAYVQVWEADPHGRGGALDGKIVGKSFDDLSPEQWVRFRRLQEALARLGVPS